MTADDLLQAIKDRGALPPSQTAITDTKLLGFINEEAQAYLAPLVASLQQGYFFDSLDTSAVAGQATYDLPPRAMVIREVCYVDSNGNEGRPLPEISPTDVWRLNQTTGSVPVGIYFNAAQVVLVPAPAASTGSLRVKYSRRLADMVLDSTSGGNHTAVGVVSSITSTLITCTNNLSGWAANTKIDIMSSVSPFKLKQRDIATTTAAASTATIAVATDMTTGVNAVVAGDYVTLAQKSWVAQLPREWHSLLELRVVARAQGILGDYSAKAEAMQSATEMQKKLVRIFTPRSTGNARKANAWR